MKEGWKVKNPRRMKGHSQKQHFEDQCRNGAEFYKLWTCIWFFLPLSYLQLDKIRHPNDCPETKGQHWFPPPTFVFLCCSRQLLCATCKSRGDIRRKDERPWEPKRVEKAEHRDGCEWKESSSSRGTGHQNESEYEWTKKNGKSRGWREKWKMPPANKIESRLEYGTGRRGAGPVVRAHAGHVRRQAAAVFHYARSRERETANWEKSRIEQRKPERRKMDRMDAGRPYRKNSAVQTT